MYPTTSKRPGRCIRAAAVASPPLSAREINALRVLINKANRPPAQAPAERQAKKVAYRTQRRADVLAWAVQRWEADYLRIRTAFPNGIAPEFGIGEKPTIWTVHLDYLYGHHINQQRMEKAIALP
jgi:hypothetical protein